MTKRKPIINDVYTILKSITPCIEYETYVSKNDMRNIIEFKERNYEEDYYDIDYESDCHLEVFQEVKEKLLQDYTEEEIQENEDYILDIIRDETTYNIVEDQDHKIICIPNDELGFYFLDKRWLDHETEDYKVLLKILDIVQISPFTFIKKYQELYNIEDALEKHDFDITQWKDIKRIPYVDVEEFIHEMESSPGYGLLTFLGCIDNHEEFYNNSDKCKYIKIPKGTTYGFYDSGEGCGSEMGATTIRDMYIEKDDNILQLEDDYYYSVDSCYGFVGSVWYDSSFSMSNENGITYNQVLETAEFMLNSYTADELKTAAELLYGKRHELKRLLTEELEMLPTHTYKIFLKDNIKYLRYTTLTKYQDGKFITYFHDIKQLLLQAETELESYKRNHHLNIIL